MTNNQTSLIEKAQISRATANTISGFRTAKIGKEDFIDSRYGKIRILKYGFNNNEVKPLYIDLHGGGFILFAADADEYINIFTQEAAGVKIVSIDYPKAPENSYPIPVEAVYDVILHFVHNADKYKLDINNLGIGGHSSGANISNVISMKAKLSNDFSIAYQVLDYPPLDLYTPPHKKPVIEGAIVPALSDFFNECYIGDVEKAKDPFVSPIFATNDLLKCQPPTLIIAAGIDSLHDEDIKYSEMLKAAGVSVELYEAPNSPHGFTVMPSEETDKALTVITNFIKKYIG